MNKNSKDKKYELTEQEILAFEREKFDSKVLKKYRKSKNKSPKILVLLRILFIVIFIGSAGYLFKWQSDNKKNKAMRDSLSEYISTATPSEEDSTLEEEFTVDFDNLTSINNSCFAWLIVNGTNVSYPIVKYTNNDYYLTHSFDKSYNPAGWIYADYRIKGDGTDKNLVIYGHNRRDGSMFASLLTILDENWYSNSDNLVISLYTKNGLEKYQVFSVYEIKSEPYYLTTYFSSDYAYSTFLNKIKSRSIHDFNIDVTTEDNILTLSTCSNNTAYRTVLHAKKIQAEV